MTFNTETFMLKNQAALQLYEEVKRQPIFDYHLLEH